MCRVVWHGWLGAGVCVYGVSVLRDCMFVSESECGTVGRCGRGLFSVLVRMHVCRVNVCVVVCGRVWLCVGVFG